MSIFVAEGSWFVKQSARGTIGRKGGPHAGFRIALRRGHRGRPPPGLPAGRRSVRPRRRRHGPVSPRAALPRPQPARARRARPGGPRPVGVRAPSARIGGRSPVPRPGAPRGGRCRGSRSRAYRGRADPARPGARAGIARSRVPARAALRRGSRRVRRGAAAVPRRSSPRDGVPEHRARGRRPGIRPGPPGRRRPALQRGPRPPRLVPAAPRLPCKDFPRPGQGCDGPLPPRRGLQSLAGRSRAAAPARHGAAHARAREGRPRGPQDRLVLPQGRRERGTHARGGAAVSRRGAFPEGPLP